MDGPDGTLWMISGLLALLQHMERVDHVVVVQRAKAELSLRLRMYPLRFRMPNRRVVNRMTNIIDHSK
jgi:hypothetical protein